MAAYGHGMHEGSVDSTLFPLGIRVRSSNCAYHHQHGEQEGDEQPVSLSSHTRRHRCQQRGFREVPRVHLLPEVSDARRETSRNTILAAGRSKSTASPGSAYAACLKSPICASKARLKAGRAVQRSR